MAVTINNHLYTNQCQIKSFESDQMRTQSESKLYDFEQNNELNMKFGAKTKLRFKSKKKKTKTIKN